VSREPNSEASVEFEHLTANQTSLLVSLMVVAACVVVAVHWPALSAQAISFDDHQYLLENQLVQNPSWASVYRILTEVTKPSSIRGYYQPLAMISLMLDYAMGGRPDNLLPFHITSLCLHVINTLLVIAFLYALFGKVWPAVIVGLLFGVHPLTVEPIPWIGERKTLLASFFALWCLLIYVRYTHKHSWSLLAGCAVMYVLSLMAKPTTTPLPVLLLLLDFWPLRRPIKKALIEKIPLFVIMVISAVITVISQSRTASIAMPGEYSLRQIPLILCHNIIFYLYKIIWPANLSSYYAFPRPFDISEPMILAGVIGTCVLLPVLLISLRWTRSLLTGWLFFFVGILPTMGLIGFTNVIASDKYAYLPSVGFLMIFAQLLVWLWDSVRGSLIRRIIIIVFMLALTGSESIATRRYLTHWQTTENLFSYMLALTPNSFVLHNNYGCFLFKKGQVGEAAKHFEKTLQLNPVYLSALNNLGAAYCAQGKTELSIICYNKVLELEPNNVDAINNLAWFKATEEDPNCRNSEDAIRLATDACKLTSYEKPYLLDTLAAAYAASGKFGEAVATAEKALELAQSLGDKELAEEIRKHLYLYEAGQPYVELHNKSLPLDSR
jgi:Tfp pilus assembly protein PilF